MKLFGSMLFLGIVVAVSSCKKEDPDDTSNLPDGATPYTETDIQFRYGMKGGKHLGPVLGMQRCPYATKYFLSVGDWTARVIIYNIILIIFKFLGMV